MLGLDRLTTSFRATERSGIKGFDESGVGVFRDGADRGVG
jgi:hypothetical protein